MQLDQLAPPCPFLALPVELRLQIYSHALLDSSAITISSAEVIGNHSDIVHRLYGHDRNPCPGLPLNHEPIISESYDPALLSITTPLTLPATSQTVNNNPKRNTTYPSCPSLFLLNKQINDELNSHFNLPHARNLSLFLSFPSALHIFRTLTPSLLHRTRSIHLAGRYTPSSYSSAHRAVLPPYHPPPASQYNGKAIPDTATQLADLIKSLFGPDACHSIAKLEMRIYYPGEDSYSTVWGDDRSPVVLALRNINIGEIGITVYRGRYGTGVYLTSQPSEERRRMVSTVWKKLEEGRKGEPRCGSWVVDPQWPAWGNDEETRDGKGDTVLTSLPRQDGNGVGS